MVLCFNPGNYVCSWVGVDYHKWNSDGAGKQGNFAAPGPGWEGGMDGSHCVSSKVVLREECEHFSMVTGGKTESTEIDTQKVFDRTEGEAEAVFHVFS
jgi:hypothetical protein